LRRLRLPLVELHVGLPRSQRKRLLPAGLQISRQRLRLPAERLTSQQRHRLPAAVRVVQGTNNCPVVLFVEFPVEMVCREFFYRNEERGE
jgi:hypothetical protein